jgi:hypothetical protein
MGLFVVYPLGRILQLKRFVLFCFGLALLSRCSEGVLPTIYVGNVIYPINRGFRTTIIALLKDKLWAA